MTEVQRYSHSNQKDCDQATNEELADFAPLAKPDEIAGQWKTLGGKQEPGVVERLRAELQRREREIHSLRTELAATRVKGASASHGTSPQNEADGLRRQLAASLRAGREMHDQLADRDTVILRSQQEQSQLRSALDRMQREFENYATERARLRSLRADLSTSATGVKQLTDERDSLQRTAASARLEANDARENMQRLQAELDAANEGCEERHLEAAALRSALITNQKQSDVRECKINELETALSIASDTLTTRRGELKALREKLDECIAELAASTEQTAALEQSEGDFRSKSEQQLTEIDILTMKSAGLRAQQTDRNAKIEELHERIAVHEREFATLRERAESAEETSAVVSGHLEEERQALAKELERAKLREKAAADLRDTLATIGKAASILPPGLPPVADAQVSQDVPAKGFAEFDAKSSVETASAESSGQQEPDVLEDSPSVGAESNETKFAAATIASASQPIDAELEAVRAAIPGGEPLEALNNETGSKALSPFEFGGVAPPAAEAFAPALLTLVPARPMVELPAVFRSWRDRQIAKQLAPMGVRGADDYFAGRIDSILEANPNELTHILSLGGEDLEFELRVAQDLRRRGREAFRIHYPDADPENAGALVRRAGQVGIDVELVPYAHGGPMTLNGADIRAIISDGALSRGNHTEALLDLLRRTVAEEAIFVVAERTGVATGDLAREMGDRIWQLMPERYKTNTLTGIPESNYECVNSDAANNASNNNQDLLALLRANYVLEDYASFGHLIDRFVSREIGPNFDPADERDGRFIEQIASLDAAKLDAGALEPRHMVARLRNR